MPGSWIYFPFRHLTFCPSTTNYAQDHKVQLLNTPPKMSIPLSQTENVIIEHGTDEHELMPYAEATDHDASGVETPKRKFRFSASLFAFVHDS